MGRKNNAGFQPLPKMLPHNVPYISNPEDRGERLQAEVFRAAGRKILCKRFSTKSRMVLESRADSGLNP